MRTRTTGRPRRAAIVGALAAAVALSAPAAAQAACGGVQHYSPTKRRSARTAPLAIGDSVMLGAIEPLRRAGFEIDVRGCRQMSEGLQVLSGRRRASTLPAVVVVALGTNWTVPTAEIRRALRIMGTDRGSWAWSRRAESMASALRPASIARGRQALADPRQGARLGHPQRGQGVDVGRPSSHLLRRPRVQPAAERGDELVLAG